MFQDYSQDDDAMLQAAIQASLEAQWTVSPAWRFVITSLEALRYPNMHNNDWHARLGEFTLGPALPCMDP